ncbi:MAG TPA: CoA transferase [Acidimicrobiales bacterium]
MSGPGVPPVPQERSGPLGGFRVIEVASEWTAFAGKLLGDLGAEVILVEPPEGASMRGYGPFADDHRTVESSLWWWHYQTSKLGVTLDLAAAGDAARFRRLVASADIVLEGEPPERLGVFGADGPATLLSEEPRLIWVSVTPFGRDNSRSNEPATDLTILAGGGPVWACGYDDHRIPPVRGGGNQALHTAGLYAVGATMVAVLYRGGCGLGQHVDVSMHAAANVTTEAATFSWLVGRRTLHRQTGRHASVDPTMPTMVSDADGLPVQTGAPPRSASEFRAVLNWLDDLGLRDQFLEAFLLEMGVERGGVRYDEVAADPDAQAIYGAGRDALVLIASRLGGYRYFVDGQERGLATGVIYGPEDVPSDPHYAARGFPTSVAYEGRAAPVIHPGAPFSSPASPFRLAGRAPHLGEHNDRIFAAPAAAADQDRRIPPASDHGRGCP